MPLIWPKQLLPAKAGLSPFDREEQEISGVLQEAWEFQVFVGVPPPDSQPIAGKTAFGEEGRRGSVLVCDAANVLGKPLTWCESRGREASRLGEPPDPFDLSAGETHVSAGSNLNSERLQAAPTSYPGRTC